MNRNSFKSVLTWAVIARCRTREDWHTTFWKIRREWTDAVWTIGILCSLFFDLILLGYLWNWEEFNRRIWADHS